MFRLTLFLFVLLIPFFIKAENITLSVGLKNAITGQYLVFEQEKMATLFRVVEKREGSLLFEEVSIPLHSFCRMGLSFREWYERGAESNTSWTLSEIDLEKGLLLRCYSFTQEKWTQKENVNPFLTTLFSLNFEETPPTRRKKAGPTPGFGKPDLRPLWQPRLIREGALIPSAPFSAYSSSWPNDSSEMANMRVEIYLPSNPDSSPSFLPYFLEVQGKITRSKMRVIDSGSSLFNAQLIPF